MPDLQDQVPGMPFAQVHRLVSKVRAAQVPGNRAVALDMPAQVRQVRPLQLPARALFRRSCGQPGCSQARVGTLTSNPRRI